ncbi:MAG: hypothetical protein ABI693_03135 [Bryobacteraceae bacterium]
MLRLVLAVLCLAAGAMAQVSIRLLEDRRYHEGELILAEVQPLGQPFVAGRPLAKERWQYGGFLLDPPRKCGSLATPCFQSMALWFDKSDPMLGFGDATAPRIVCLNHYLPPLMPGHYRLALLARKLVLTRQGLRSSYGSADPPRYSLSNAVEVEIVPASDAWVKQAIAASTAVLSSPPPDGGPEYDRRKLAAEQLRQFDRPEAWRASLAMMPAEEYTLLEGLAASHEPAHVCELMRTAIAAPAQAVSSYYLYAFTQTCAKADLPPPPAPGPNVEKDPYWELRRAYEQRLTSKACDILASSLASKQNSAKVAALETLVNRVQHLRMNEPTASIPSWLPATKDEFKKVYPLLDGWRRRQMLSLFATTYRSPDLAPLLESEMDAWKPGAYYEGPRGALYDLNLIDPVAAQARIVTELGREKTWLDDHALALLPPQTHFNDGALVEALAAALRPGGWDPQLRTTALAKFGASLTLPRVKAIFESQSEQCQPELMAYFIRIDPAYAQQALARSADQRCILQYMQRTPPLAMGPVLEQYITSFLGSGDVALKMEAAHSLGRYGSPAAAEPLWKAFRYFNAYWKNRQAEVAESGDVEESMYRNALARGQNWLTTEATLHTIESLCSTDRCRYDTQDDLRGWQSPLKIQIDSSPNGFRCQVAQYSGIETLEALEGKLSQFPKGTEFRLAGYGAANDAVLQRLRDFGSKKGLLIR